MIVFTKSKTNKVSPSKKLKIQKENLGIQYLELENSLYINNENKLCIKTTDKAELNNKTPITSHGVSVEVGNIEVLLRTI